MSDHQRQRLCRHDSGGRRSHRHISVRRRSHSPYENNEHLHHATCRHKRRVSRSPKTAELPLGSRPLSKYDFQKYRPMFALYLDIQKQIVLDELEDVEAKGRWKSFIGKWNRGELAEGWYDPFTREKAVGSSTTREDICNVPDRHSRASPEYRRMDMGHHANVIDESDDEVVGPALPVHESSQQRKGPAIPGSEDLLLRQERAREDSLTAQDDIRIARKIDRKHQKERLEELVPRAEAGTRESRLEKRKEVNEKMRSFRDKSPGAADEMGDQDLMGNDGAEVFKAQKKEFERKKNERELRKEEMLQIRAAEREERLQEHRAKEDKTMAMLKALAKQNFG